MIEVEPFGQYRRAFDSRLFSWRATRSPDAPRKIAAFFGCRLAKLVHPTAQQSVVGLVGLGANKSSASIDFRLLHQSLKLPLTELNATRLVRHLPAAVEDVFVRRGEIPACRLRRRIRRGP